MEKPQLKIAAFLGVVFILVSLYFFSPLGEYLSVEIMKQVLAKMRDSFWAMPLFVLFYLVAEFLFMPSAVLAMFAGATFGLYKGFLVMFVGANLSVALDFYLARWLGRDFIQRFIKVDSIAGKLSSQFEKNGFLVTLYLRLIPLIPMNVVNYAAGLTRIKFKYYMYANLLGMIPGTFAYVHTGATAIDIRDNPWAITIPLGFLVSLTLAAQWAKRKGFFKDLDEPTAQEQNSG